MLLRIIIRSLTIICLSTCISCEERSKRQLSPLDIFRHVGSAPVVRAAQEGISNSLQNDPLKNVNKDKPQKPDKPQGRLLNADERFQKCCDVAGDVQGKCKQTCQYEKLSKNAILGAYLRRDCTFLSLGGVLHCISRKQDHRECCQQKGVTEMCMYFCAMTHMPPQKVDLKFLPCADSQLGLIRQCFREYDDANPIDEHSTAFYSG